jgi:lysyl-tRNA synthetase class II
MTQEDEQIAQRRANLAALAARGVETYPRRFDRTHTIAELVDAHGNATGEALDAARVETTTAGRVLAIRSFG